MDEKRPNRSRNSRAKPAEKPEDAYGYLMWYLNKFGDTSEAKLREKLQNKTDNPEWVDFAINKAIDLGFQSDRRCAEQIVRRGLETKMWGKIRIQQELKRKGIPTDVANEALTALNDDDPVARATDALGKKFRGRSIIEKKEQAKAARYLASRGFSFDTIFSAIGQHNEECQ